MGYRPLNIEVMGSQGNKSWRKSYFFCGAWGGGCRLTIAIILPHAFVCRRYFVDCKSASMSPSPRQRCDMSSFRGVWKVTR